MPGRYRFPRAERLTQKAAYHHVFRHGEKLVGRAFICYVVRREGQGCKLGMAVSRKVGSAVVRNHVKRCIREFYRTQRSHFRQEVALVVVARPPAAALNCVECGSALRQMLTRGGIL